ncbi:STAS domain-containing protein [Amycolatopsis mongoliensis]|uniref:STAS domain-containing protein n=1 Tax=Amycolatopsis mongoliensis TaxID=715475 RepID=A0A9Y2JMU4_9PSEU|nr:STAS domain-containing protein [Amycolatopsis sp. 4-36]WIY00162.1 STAS domain-containing protein [Amycolatopsis sp. 4-36]
MTSGLTCTWTATDGATARVAIAGELEFATARLLLHLVTDRLADHPGVRDVRLDCGGIAFCDSSGLSTLLLVHRAVTGAGSRLYLDNRPPALDRLLALTGTTTYLTGESADSRARRDS